MSRTSDKPVYATLEEAIAGYTEKLGTEYRRWDYHDADGEIVLIILRWDNGVGGKKGIRPIRGLEEGWIHQEASAGRPLYRLGELLESDDTVYVAEGEPAAEALAAVGLTATTSSGGCKASSKTDWLPFAGRDVVILPDNDLAGEEYGDAVLEKLLALEAQPRGRVVELPGLPERGDAKDWFSDGHPLEELDRLVQATDPVALAEAERPLRFRPFPTHLLPEPMQSFVAEAAQAIGCEPCMIALPALAAAAGIRALKLKGTWCEPAVLWCVVVSPSGLMKSQGRKLVLAATLRRQKQELANYGRAIKAHEEVKLRYEKELAQWKRAKLIEPPPSEPERPVLVEPMLSDTTVEAVAKVLHANPRGLLLDRDELAAWFGSFDQYKSGGGDAQNWMNMHGAGYVKVNRAGSLEPIYVDKAAVSVTGTIQPAILTEVLTKEHRESGLAARLLIACPPRRPKRWTDEEVSEPVERAFSDRMLDLLDLRFTLGGEGGLESGVLKLSAAAQRLWKDFVNRHGEEGLDRHGDELAAWSKLEGYAARLALVMALFENPDALTVDDDLLARAIELMEWFANEMARFYQGAHETEANRELRELVEWIDSKHDGVVTPRQLTQGRRHVKNVAAAEAMIQRLIEAGHGDWRVTPSATKSRREFALNGASTSTDSPKSPDSGENVDVDTRQPAENAPGDDGWESA